MKEDKQKNECKEEEKKMEESRRKYDQNIFNEWKEEDVKTIGRKRKEKEGRKREEERGRKRKIERKVT